MNILTVDGWKNIEDVIIGEEILAYDVVTGLQIVNTVLNKERFYPEMDEGFYDNHGDFTFYLINEEYKLFKNQSIWRNDDQVVHAKDLEIGDVIYDWENNPVIVTSISETTEPEWWRMTISGDHSYISDGLTLHNASRFWVGGGSSSNWSATGNTNWAASSGGAGNQSVPTSTDDVTFDGAGGTGNSASTMSATTTILSITFTAGYTQTITFSNNQVLTVAGNFTDNTAHSWTMGNAGCGLTISATSTITSGGKTFPSFVTFTGTNTKTLSGDWTITGTLTISGTTTLNWTTNEKLNVGGSLTMTGGYNCSGTAKIVLNGTGTWATFSSNSLSNSLDINTAGTITIGTNANFLTGTLTYVAGTVTTTSSTLGIWGSCTLNTNGITWNNVSLGSNNQTVTINSLLTVNGTLSIGSNLTVTFGGTAGFTTNTLTFSQSGSATVTFTQTNSYTITTALNGLLGAFSAPVTIASSSATLLVPITLNRGATCNTNASFTRVDASGGRPINTFSGTVTNCLNINTFTDEPRWFPSRRNIIGMSKTY